MQLKEAYPNAPFAVEIAEEFFADQAVHDTFRAMAEMRGFEFIHGAMFAKILHPGIDPRIIKEVLSEDFRCYLRAKLGMM